jgi:hypothetical protein
MAIDIVKLANGNIAIYDTTSGDFIRGMSPDIVEIECNELGIVKVIQDNGSVEYFDPADVANTEVVPAAAIPFSGDCAALASLLATDFFFVVSGGGAGSAVVPFYANSVWTSFQMDAKAVSTTNLGSNSAYAVGFNVPVATRIKNAQIECTVWVGNVNAEFALYKVENGIATERIYRDDYLITGTGFYSFVVNLDLAAGNYAYAVNQDLIMGYRTISNPDNIFGVDPLGGANVYPWAKTAIVAAVPFLPDPFPVGQTNYNLTAVPLAIFEIEII